MTPGVLIVDDSLTVRMDLKEGFESAGFTATVCETIGSARKALAENQFAFIVLDVLLPDGDGVQLLAELKGQLSQRPAALEIGAQEQAMIVVLPDSPEVQQLIERERLRHERVSAILSNQTPEMPHAVQ